MAPMALLTAEEFARLPQPEDDSLQELVNGVVVTVPPSSFHHGRVCMELVMRLGDCVEDRSVGVVTCNNSGVILGRNPDTVRGPDLAFWSHERMPDPPRHGYATVAPDLAIEVLCASDTFGMVHFKVRQYLDAGVRLVWIIDPEANAVVVFRPGPGSTILANGETLSGEDVLPGFSCPVAELFP